jgi:F-type H+-transporting ATPase subunit delta
MTISKQARREAKELLRRCQVNGLLDENRVHQAVRLVLAAKPRAYMALLWRFRYLVKLELDCRTARVESAAPLPAELQAALTAGLALRHGPGLLLSFAQNPALIGGLRLQVGSDLYDGTVRARLAALEAKF